MTDRARVTEVAPDHHSISIYVPEFNLRFNHFLIKDDEEPLLFHTAMKQMLPLVRDAVARVIDPSALRWISFSQFEADECGALVSVNDFGIRQARVLAQDDILTTGTYRFRFLQTPHVPHNREASLLFEEVTHTLRCSDLFTHEGDVEAVTGSDVGWSRKAGVDRGAARAFCEPPTPIRH